MLCINEDITDIQFVLFILQKLVLKLEKLFLQILCYLSSILTRHRRKHSLLYGWNS